MVARHVRLGLVSLALAAIAILIWPPEPSPAAGAVVATPIGWDILP